MSDVERDPTRTEDVEGDSGPIIFQVVGDRYYVSCPDCSWRRYITGRGKAGKAYGGHRKIHTGRKGNEEGA